MPSSKGPIRPGDQTLVSCIASGFVPPSHWGSPTKTNRTTLILLRFISLWDHISGYSYSSFGGNGYPTCLQLPPRWEQLLSWNRKLQSGFLYWKHCFIQVPCWKAKFPWCTLNYFISPCHHILKYFFMFQALGITYSRRLIGAKRSIRANRRLLCILHVGLYMVPY